MFRNLLSRLLVDEPDDGVLTRDDADLVVAALLVRAARMDAHYSESEQRLIDHVLARRSGLDLDEATDRRMAAEMIEAEAPDTGRLTCRVTHWVSLEDRISVIAAIGRITHLDAPTGTNRDSLIRLVASLMAVPNVEAILAEQHHASRHAAPLAGTG